MTNGALSRINGWAYFKAVNYLTFQMQETKDIIIIGGGVIGLTSAWFLRRQGLKVCVIDQASMGLEASWAAGGILSSLTPWQETESVAQLAAYGQEHYASFCYELMEKSGIDAEWQQSGLFLTQETCSDGFTNWVQKTHQTVEVELESSSCFSGEYSGEAKAGYLLPNIAQLKPPALLLSLKTALALVGVELIENTSVSEILTEESRVLGANTSEGKLYADKTLVCAGAWTQKLMPNLAIKPVKGEMLSLKAFENVEMKRILLDKGKYLIPRLDGSIVVGSTLEDTGFDTSTSETAKSDLLKWAQEYLPALNSDQIQGHWSGLRPKPERNRPVIGQSSQWEQLYFSTGHFRNGILLALGSAKLMSDLICAKESFMSVNDFAL